MPKPLFKLFTATALLALLLVPALAQGIAPDGAAKMLPDRVGDFRAQGPPSRPSKGGVFERAAPEDFDAVSEAVRSYASARGKSFEVRLVKTLTDSGAYSLLTEWAGPQSRKLDGVGTDGRLARGSVAFFKGPAFVTVSGAGGKADEEAALTDFARLLAGTLDGGEEVLPVLVQHLPGWPQVQERADFAVSLPALQAAAGQRPVLDAVSFEGGAEAATATYDASRLIIVEFTTPQYAAEADTRVTERIAQLRGEGRPVPSLYRRVGNYSVFVFDAPDEAAAANLVEGVKYEKDVRWLGDNPRLYERAIRDYSATMGGVILGTLKVTGLAILACLSVGGLFGGAVFLYRRAKSAGGEAYSDAGGMMRLNIEDVNAPRPAAGMLRGGGEE